MKDTIKVTGKICAVLTRADGTVENYETTNTVTNDGDLYYAERGAGQAVPTDFTNTSGTFDGIMELYTATGSGAVAKGNDRSDLGTLTTDSAKAMDSGYPKVNDLDSGNSGKGTDVVTYKVSYTTAEAIGSDIDDVCITNPSPGSSENLLFHAAGLGTFAKTSSDTLVVYINHTFNGT